MALFYLSFADATLPAGEQFLGAAIVHADSFQDAVKESWLLQINPGGEVQGHPVVSPVTMEGIDVPIEFVAKLLSRSEIGRLVEWVEANQ